MTFKFNLKIEIIESIKVMKYNAYIVELKQKDTTFTGSLVLRDATILPANFKKIGKDLFIANFKSQVEFSFLEKVPLKSKNKDAVVLIPVTSKYNKRKLTKISKFFTAVDPGEREKKDILLNFLSVDKFVKAQDLLEFFSVSREEIIPVLIDKEVGREIKIIDFSHLSIASYDTIQGYHDALDTLFTDYYTSRVKSVKLSDIESKLKLSQSSLLFKYLLRSSQNHYPFQIRKERVVFKKLAMSETEKDSLTEIESIIKKNKAGIFSIENITHSAGLVSKNITDSLWFLVDDGRLVQLNEKYFILNDDLNKILNKLKKYKRNEGDLIDIQSFRELTLFTRKYIIALFEYFDANDITQRVDNQRKILLGA
ncbi:MAG: hypothetical protein GY940_15635 [bacterium]|nr:hypothetical protein [bacterium]